MEEIVINRERTQDTFAAHKARREEYGSEMDTIMQFAIETEYDIDMVREERAFRDLV